MGLVLLSASFGALFAMPFTGWLITQNGSKRITQLSGFALMFIVPIFTLSPNAIVLTSIFFVVGLITGTMDVAMNAQAVVVEKQIKKPIMSFFHAMFSLGMTAGAGCGSLFIKLEQSLLVHFSIVCLIALVLLLISFQFLVDDEVKDEDKPTSVFQLPEAALVGIGVIAFCCMLGEGAMADWSTNYMLNTVNIEKAAAPFGLIAFSGAMMIGRFTGDIARKKVGDTNLLHWGSLLACMGLALTIFFPFPIFAIAGMLLVGLGLSTIVPIAYSQAGNYPGLAAGVGIGMVTTIGYAGFLFGPPIIGFIADWYSLRTAFYFILALFVIMSFLTFLNKKQ